jgi:hypothetical protein
LIDFRWNGAAQGSGHKAQGKLRISNLEFEILGFTLRPAPCALSFFFIFEKAYWT